MNSPVAHAPGPWTRREPLDLATLEAVHALREAVRLVRDLERGELVGASPVQRGHHAAKTSRARIARLKARVALEAMLLGDD